MSEPIGSSVAILPPLEAEPTHSAHAFSWTAIWILLLSLSALLSSALVIALHTTHGFFLPVLATAICTVAALFDASTRRIPNPLTYTAILLALAINALASIINRGDAAHLSAAAHWLAAPGITQSLLGFSVCAALGILAALARAGGGDIKLLAALGALMGLADIGSALLVALSVAVLFALINLALSGRLNNVVRILSIRALELLYFRRYDPVIALDDAPEMKRLDMIPMAVPMALGLLIAQLLDIKSRLGVTG